MKSKLLGTVTAAMIAASSIAFAESPANPMRGGETWLDLRGDVIGDVNLIENDTLFELSAPHRAHDPATVPIKINQAKRTGSQIRTLALIVDENPAPVAATFTFGETMGDIDMEVRIRINEYSNVRAVATTDSGENYMSGKYVKASGGCSAPANKDPELAASTMGNIKFREIKDEAQQQSTIRREAKLQVRHPNFSGLQRDQLTLLTIPAHFISELEVHQGNDLLFSMEGGISISEDPTFHFFYMDNGAEFIHVHAKDTEGNEFEQTFSKYAIAG